MYSTNIVNIATLNKVGIVYKNVYIIILKFFATLTNLNILIY